MCAADRELTNGGEYAGEAEVVNGVEGEQMEEELLLLLFTAEEGVALVELPVAHTTQSQVRSHPSGGSIIECLNAINLHSLWETEALILITSNALII